MARHGAVRRCRCSWMHPLGTTVPSHLPTVHGRHLVLTLCGGPSPTLSENRPRACHPLLLKRFSSIEVVLSSALSFQPSESSSVDDPLRHSPADDLRMTSSLAPPPPWGSDHPASAQATLSPPLPMLERQHLHVFRWKRTRSSWPQSSHASHSWCLRRCAIHCPPLPPPALCVCGQRHLSSRGGRRVV